MADNQKPIDKLLVEISTIADEERSFAQKLREQTNLNPVSAQVNNMLMRKAESIANALDSVIAGFALRSMLNAADGLPARPVAIEDVPLSYVKRADFKAPDSDPAIHGRLVAEDTSDVE